MKAKKEPTVAVALKIPKDLKATCAAVARAHGLTLDQWINRLICEYFHLIKGSMR